MTDNDYHKLLSFKNVHGSALIPDNSNALEFIEQLKRDEIVVFKNVTARDLKLHRCYFLVLAEVWGYMPKKFRDIIPKDTFYKWVKMYQKKYTVLFSFKDGTQMIELESISFGRMNNNAFKDFVKEQIPTLYDILMECLPKEFSDAAIETIEENFEKMFSKL